MAARPAALRLSTQKREVHVLLRGQSGTSYQTRDAPFQYGRTSVFYEAIDMSGLTVCAKVFRELDPRSHPKDKLDEFVREIALRQQSRLEHPNILPILDFGVHDSYQSQPFLILPICEDGDLRQHLRPGEHIPLEEGISFLRLIAGALDFAHQRGIIHGDIKPENVLFKKFPSTAYLTDFGAARWIIVRARISGEAGGSTDHRGTEDYLSPEELEDGTQSTASDIYSFATLVYEVITGHLPFDTNLAPFKQMEARINGRLRDARDAHPGLSSIVALSLKAALSVQPRQRPRTATQLCDMLVGRHPLVDLEVGMSSSKVVPAWFPLAGLGFAILTTLFFMALVALSLFNITPQPQAHSLISLTASLSAAFTFTFLGAEASAKGHVPLPIAKDHPIVFSTGGGVAVFVISIVLIAWLFPTPS